MSADQAETITAHHVRVIRGHMAFGGLTARELAKRAGVSPTTVQGIVNGQYTSSRHLGRVLAALGLPRPAPLDLVIMHAQLMDAVVAVGNADPRALAPILAALHYIADTAPSRRR